MGLEEFLFPEHWQRMKLESMSHRVGAQSASARRNRRAAKALKQDLGLLSLTLMALIDSLCRRGIIDRDDLLASLQTVDRLDGVEDGSVDPEAIRTALGVKAPKRKPLPKRTAGRLKRRRKR